MFGSGVCAENAETETEDVIHLVTFYSYTALYCMWSIDVAIIQTGHV